MVFFTVIYYLIESVDAIGIVFEIYVTKNI
jgi:hypothetical protein